jgi:hypothetical protein
MLALLEYIVYYIGIGVIIRAYLGHNVTGDSRTIATIVAWPVVIGILVVKGLVSLIKD